MFAIVLTAVASFFQEIGSSIGKIKVSRGEESIYTMWFLNFLWGIIFFGIVALWKGDFVFSAASLPTFGIRLILELFQMTATMYAIAKADRSTFGFVRTGTIPILLFIDISLGYSINTQQFLGITIITAGLLFLFINHGIKTKGIWFVAFTTVNAAATISLYKYNITHFNSVTGEQIVLLAILLTYCFLMAVFISRQNPLRFLTKPIYLLQSAAMGVSDVLMSFAYLFASPSIITTAKRALTVLWAIFAGNVYFKEKHLLIKTIGFLIITIGLFLIPT